MSMTGATVLIVLVTLLLIGLLLYARHRGRISRTASLVLALIIVAIGSVVFLYPSVLILES